MRCSWQELLAILPQWMQRDVDALGSQHLKEIRLRIDSPPELILNGKKHWMKRSIKRDDLNFVVNTASKYSPWAVVSSAQGFITIKGGHRIGICGEVIVKHGQLVGIREYSSLCIRVARDFQGIAAGLENIDGSILILGPPGWGKTTLLRDMIRRIGDSETIGVVDERGELFPAGFERGNCTDVLTGSPKEQGISMLLRTMGPSSIAVDEITDQQDTTALLHAANCGVRLIASAHSDSLKSFCRRSVYRNLVENHVFDVVLIMNKDHSYTMERMKEWAGNGLVHC